MKSFMRLLNKNIAVPWNTLPVSNDKAKYSFFPRVKGYKRRIYSIQFRISTLSTTFTVAANGKLLNVIQEIRETSRMSSHLISGGESNKFAFCRHYETDHGNNAGEEAQRYFANRFHDQDTWLYPKGVDLFGDILWIVKEGGHSNCGVWAVNPIFSVAISYELIRLTTSERLLILFSRGKQYNYT